MLHTVVDMFLDFLEILFEIQFRFKIDDRYHFSHSHEESSCINDIMTSQSTRYVSIVR